MTQWDKDFQTALKSLCRVGRPGWDSTAKSIAELAGQIATEATKIRDAHQPEEDAREHADHRKIISAFLSSGPSRTKYQIEDAALRSLGDAFDRQKFNAALWYLLDNKDICVEVSEDGSHRFDLDIPF